MRDQHSSPDAVKRLRRARFFDRLASRSISIGGVGVLIAVVAIFVFIGYEVVPLLGSASADEANAISVSDAPILAVDVDEYRELVAVARADGRLQVLDAETGDVRYEEELTTDTLHAAVFAGKPSVVIAVGESGRIHSATLTPRIEWSDAGERRVHADVEVHEAVDVREDGALHRVAAMVADDEYVMCIVAADDGYLASARFRLGGSRVRVNALEGGPAEPATTVAIAPFGSDFRAYAGCRDGRVFRWDGGWRSDPERYQSVLVENRAITALSPLLGGEALIVGTASGSLSAWFGVRATPDAPGWDLTRIRDFDPMPSAVESIAPSRRSKSFLVADDAGNSRVVHNTTDRTLVELPPLDAHVVATAFAPKADGLYLADDTGGIHGYDYDAPHPETTGTTLFAPVWYEGAVQPEYKWQSTGGDDAFEPKLSLSVLVFGSLKGVLYALAFAVPAALLAAIYTGLFLPAGLRNIVKPAIELMAAIPSVIVGLLAALWLSPIVERNLVSVFTTGPAFLLSFAVLLIIWLRLPRQTRVRLLRGPQLMLVVLPAVLSPVAIAYLLGPWAEEAVFGGDIKSWLDTTLGLAYDPRNAMVVGFAMGFAVIPVIFTISEDAISNVPKSLWAASEALGATRWQTTWRVVLPAATPGLFSALMLGFGRAIGETMIVLMATGNTPILDFSPFNGMRTISACIAVEVPEAPHGGTLYRVLFLSGVLLFSFTFLCNTVAEVVGQRLRRKYGRL